MKSGAISPPRYRARWSRVTSPTALTITVPSLPSTGATRTWWPTLTSSLRAGIPGGLHVVGAAFAAPGDAAGESGRAGTGSRFGCGAGLGRSEEHTSEL